MKPVNIYRVSRIRDEELFNIAEKHESSDHDDHRIRIHEIESLRILTDALISEGMTVSDAEGFYLGFIIPQVGKEFDLLKVTGKYCLNIELKSQNVSEEQILTQLRKNRHYLNYLGRELMLFTAVTDTMTCYKLSDDDRLVRSDPGEMARAVRRCNAAYHGRIEKLFRASEYLISPDNDPGKFLQGHYFLTPAQDYVKSELLRSIEAEGAGSLYHIAGRPCTGKTLLLFDIAKELSEKGNTLIVCGSDPSTGLIEISRALGSLHFIAAEYLRSADYLKDYRYVLVDEALRLEPDVFDMICDAASDAGRVFIFSTDPDSSYPAVDEKSSVIEERIRGLDLAGEYELSEKLRMNMEIYTFILKLKHLGCKTEKSYEYEHVSVNYANDAGEAHDMISYFREKGYVFINAHLTEDDPYADLREDFSTQHVLGREYSKVVMLMDKSFCYDREGFLQGIPDLKPGSVYPNIFYRNITRVRDRLALVIVDAPELLRNVLSILNQ